MNDLRGNRWIRILTGYYGILQLSHLFFLGRAGLILLQTGRVPFPASPPPGGWSSEVLPFLMGMGAADVFAASIGIWFSYSFLIKDKVLPLSGIISLTIALSSAVVYLVGTIPGGAWVNNPISYLIVILAFSPIMPLYLVLVRETASKIRSII